MILLYRAVDGFSEYEEFARIEDGEIIEGEFHPPPDVDLSDEKALLQRYTGPGCIATELPDEQGGTESSAGKVYQCTMCGTTHEADREATDTERWMPCPECSKDRFFELMGE